jgi:hypothetical protein
MISCPPQGSSVVHGACGFLVFISRILLSVTLFGSVRRANVYSADCWRNLD